jgi:hypothetical protein
VIDLKVDYVSPNVLIDWIFQMADKWKVYLRATYLEANAGFKLLGPVLKEEQRRRGVFLHLHPFPAVGEKTARIRSALDSEFAKKRIYVLPAFQREVEEEVMAFPQSNKKDILDVLAIACDRAIIPASPEDIDAELRADEWFRNTRRNLAGY